MKQLLTFLILIFYIDCAEISHSSSQAYVKYKKDRIEKIENIKKKWPDNLNYIPQALVNIISDFFTPCSEQEFEKNTRELILAVKDNKTVRVQELLENGADINVKDQHSWTALIWAANIGHIEIVKLLINHGVDLDIKNIDGETALMRAAFNGHKEIVELLINHGANLNIKNNFGNTALMEAASNGHKEIVKLLKSRAKTQCTIL